MAEPLSGDAMHGICEALFAGRKIPAIKLYREATGVGLKEAKDFVDALEARLRQEEPERFTAPPRQGCGMTVLVILAFFCAMVVVIRL